MTAARLFFAAYLATLAAGLLFLPPAVRAEATNAVESKADAPWVVVLTDPRSERRKGSATALGYAGRMSYADDPALKRLARRLAQDHALELDEQWPISSLGVHCVVVRFGNGQDIEARLRKLRADRRVESVQPLNNFETLSESGGDPYRNLQSALDRLDLTSVHRFVTGRGVTVAIIDSAVDAKHPDLARAMRLQRDMVDDRAWPMRAERHGTGVAGVIAAAVGNDEGISGVAPNIRLTSYRACWQTDETSASRCNTLTLSRALDRAIQRQPDVLNLSLSGPADPLLERLLTILIDRGVAVVTAFDEQRTASERFPHVRDGVFFARDEAREAAVEQWWIPAPAAEILTAQPGKRYDFLSGNSIAAAHVTGMIALLLEAGPKLTAADVHRTLRDSIRHENDAASINLCAALRKVDRTMRCNV